MSYTISTRTFDLAIAIGDQGVPLQEVKALIDSVMLDAGVMPEVATYQEVDQRLLSPISAGGYDTVLGYLARNHHAQYEDYDDIATETQRHGFWLTDRCLKRGLEVIKVPAPKVLRDLGIEEVNSYPISLLVERFGD